MLHTGSRSHSDPTMHMLPPCGPIILPCSILSLVDGACLGAGINGDAQAGFVPSTKEASRCLLGSYALPGPVPFALWMVRKRVMELASGEEK